MATVNTNLVNSFGAGSGVDTKSLAQNLVDAEKAPQKKLIDDKLSATNARISGYSAMMAGLNVVKKAFTDLSTPSGINSLTVTNSQPAAFSISTTAAAKAGLRSVEVRALAQPQTAEVQFAGQGLVSKTVSLSGLTPVTGTDGSMTFDVTVTIAGTPNTVKVPVTGTAGNYQLDLDSLASAINQANLGVSASVIFPGAEADKYKLVLTGPVGSANSFSISDSSGASLGLASSNANGAVYQASSNASVVVDGVTYSRASNTISNVIPGATLTLSAPTAGAAAVQVSRDTSALKDKVNALIKAYNDTQSDLKILSGPKNTKDTTDTYSGSLQNDSTVRQVSLQLRDMVSAVSATATAGSGIKQLADIGVTIDKSGVASLDETKFNTAATTKFDAVSAALASAVLKPDGSYTKGISGSALDKLNGLMSATGVIKTRTNNANTDVTRYTKQLADLDTRMTALLDRYTKQFAAMDSIVGQSNSLRTNLKSQFDSMLSAYSNK